MVASFKCPKPGNIKVIHLPIGNRIIGDVVAGAI